jgi:hypothetical protein
MIYLSYGCLRWLNASLNRSLNISTSYPILMTVPWIKNGKNVKEQLPKQQVGSWGEQTCSLDDDCQRVTAEKKYSIWINSSKMSLWMQWRIIMRRERLERSYIKRKNRAGTKEMKSKKTVRRENNSIQSPSGFRFRVVVIFNTHQQIIRTRIRVLK